MHGLDSVDLMAHGVEIVYYFVTAIIAVVTYLMTLRF